MPRFVPPATAAANRVLADAAALRARLERAQELEAHPAEAVAAVRRYIAGDRTFAGVNLARSLAARAVAGEEPWGRELDLITHALVAGAISISQHHADWELIGQRWPGLARAMWSQVKTPSGAALRAGLSVWLPPIEADPVPVWLLAYLRDDGDNPDRWSSVERLAELEPDEERRARTRRRWRRR